MASQEARKGPPMPEIDPWEDLRQIQNWFSASPTFLDHLQDVDPETANEMTRSLLLSQGKPICDVSIRQALESILSEDWVSNYHRGFLHPGDWDPQLIENTAAGLVHHAEIDARTYRVPPSKCWVIGLSSGLLPTLRFVARAVLEAALISETNEEFTIAFEHSDAAITEAARRLGRCLGGILELGYPVVRRCSNTHAETLSLSLGVLGARFAYQHELSHLLLKHEQRPIIPNDRSYIQQAVRNHSDEFGADRSALTLMALGHRASDQDLALTYAGSSFFLQVLQWLDRFRGHSPDTHPTPGARLDRIRLLAPNILNSARPNGFSHAHSLEDFLHRLFVEVQTRLEADVTLIWSPVNEVVGRLSEPDKSPSEEAAQRFISQVALWLTLGIPEKVMTSLGQMKADAKLSNDQGAAGLVKRVECFLNGCRDEPAERALESLHAAEQYRLECGPYSTP